MDIRHVISKIGTGTGATIMGIAAVVVSIGGPLLHFYTCVFAFLHSGFWAASISFFFPFFAQIFWIFLIFQETGRFWTPLTMMSSIYLVTLAAMYLGVFIIDKSEAVVKPKDDGVLKEPISFSPAEHLTVSETEDDDTASPFLDSILNHFASGPPEGYYSERKFREWVDRLDEFLLSRNYSTRAINFSQDSLLFGYYHRFDPESFVKKAYNSKLDEDEISRVLTGFGLNSDEEMINGYFEDIERAKDEEPWVLYNYGDHPLRALRHERLDYITRYFPGLLRPDDETDDSSERPQDFDIDDTELDYEESEWDNDQSVANGSGLGEANLRSDDSLVASTSPAQDVRGTRKEENQDRIEKLFELYSAGVISLEQFRQLNSEDA